MSGRASLGSTFRRGLNDGPKVVNLRSVNCGFNCNFGILIYLTEI